LARGPRPTICRVSGRHLSGFLSGNVELPDKSCLFGFNALSEYTRRFGNVLNADNPATLFPEYNEDPAKYREAVHPAAQWIRDELFRRTLAEPGENSDGRIIFTAGGNAAGKSTALAIGGVSPEAQVVLCVRDPELLLALRCLRVPIAIKTF
jgi:hypothetical protein